MQSQIVPSILLEVPQWASQCASSNIQLPSGGFQSPAGPWHTLFWPLSHPTLPQGWALVTVAFGPSQNVRNSFPPWGWGLCPSPSLVRLSPHPHRPQLKCHFQGEAVLATGHPVLLCSQQLAFTDVFDVFMCPLCTSHPLNPPQGTLPGWRMVEPPTMRRRHSVHICQITKRPSPCLCILYVCLELQYRPRCVIFPC